MTRCWCGTRNAYFAPVGGSCGGTGTLDCICGGDFCVCHNHGEAECEGCPDCEIPLEDGFGDGYEESA